MCRARWGLVLSIVAWAGACKLGVAVQPALGVVRYDGPAAELRHQQVPLFTFLR